MTNEERLVKWKCPECGNYHKWVWSIYDIIGGEITMTCDNPECGRTSKMFMVVEKGGNATAFVADNSQGGATEIDISKVLIEGDIATIMGEKYKRIEEPEELKTLYQMWNDGECRDDICYLVKMWMSQYADNVLRGECKKGYEYCLTVLEENLK